MSSSGTSDMRSSAAASERGFLLVLLVPLLGLLAAFLLGSLRFAARAQAKAALQSRLDVCAVRVAVTRERAYSRLAKANAGVEASKKAVYAARAAMLIPGAGAAASQAADVALAANHLAAAAQDALRIEATAAEATGIRCATTSYSGQPAACLALPSLASLTREETLFPDVSGPLESTAPGALASVRCAGGRLATALEIRGDNRLREIRGYFDAYTN